MRPAGLVWPLLVVAALVGARRWLDVVEVRGRSMAPTLLPGDRLLVARLPARPGDVVLAADPRARERELVKRVTNVDGLGLTLRGDNPAFSTDARHFGALPAAAAGWRVVLRYWPLDRIGRIPPAPPSTRLDRLDEGGEPACTFPEALIAGIEGPGI
ncbi:MAG: S26 family signal peptidase [Candidatus Limnocylindria bacterium]